MASPRPYSPSPALEALIQQRESLQLQLNTTDFDSIEQQDGVVVKIIKLDAEINLLHRLESNIVTYDWV